MLNTVVMLILDYPRPNVVQQMSGLQVPTLVQHS